MRFISFGLLSSLSALMVACTFDKGQTINPATSKNTEICDTAAVVSYSAQISDIIADNCISCHGPAESVKLNNHSNVQANALAPTGSIYSSVSHDGTAIPMPPNRLLSSCDIEKIKKWVNAGAPNN
ncbi:MAG: hypothetical protein V4677_11600 [Bacteroidota bacterium]